MRILESIINNSISDRIRPTDPVARGKVLTKFWMREHEYILVKCAVLPISVVCWTGLNKSCLKLQLY
jgi:hypothetical protein